MMNEFYCEYHQEYEVGDSVEVTLYNGESYEICESAYDYNLYYCEHCDNVYFDYEDYDREESLCPSCYEEKKNNVIQYYHASHNREPEFWGNPVNNVYFGLEIESEISQGGKYELRESAKLAKNNSILSDYFTFESDGSLDVGFETISSPMSYEFIENNNILDTVCETLSDVGMVAKNSCGVHIHVSATDEVSERVGDIIYFLENNKDDVISFSGRNKNKFERWSNFYTYGDNVDRLAVYSCIIRDGERYRVVNLNNSNTIEFRLFNGTLDSNILKGYLQFASILTEYDISSLHNFKDLYIYSLDIGYTYLSDLIKDRIFNK